MAAALFAGAASGGGRAGVNLLSTFASMASRGPRRARPRLRRESNSSDLYKALGTGLLRVATVAEFDPGVLRVFCLWLGPASHNFFDHLIGTRRAAPTLRGSYSA